MHSRDTAAFRLICHMHVYTHTTNSSSGLLSSGSTRGSGCCPLVAALSPKEELGQNCMRETACFYLPFSDS